jgi:hypothetical protein
VSSPAQIKFAGRKAAAWTFSAPSECLRSARDFVDAGRNDHRKDRGFDHAFVSSDQSAFVAANWGFAASFTYPDLPDSEASARA